MKTKNTREFSITTNEKNMTTNVELYRLAKTKKIKHFYCICRDELQKITYRPGLNIVINLSQTTDEDSGTHWTALHIGRTGTPFFFDSYGVVPCLDVLAFCGKRKVNYSQTQIQDLDSNRCGEYSIAFLEWMNDFHRETELETYDNFLCQFDLENVKNNDRILMTNFF